MIYIISGASRSGKSSACMKLFDKTKIPYILTDLLMMGFQEGFPNLGVHHTKYYDENAKIMWPFVYNMIEQLIINKIDYIIEGEAFLEKDIASLVDKYPDDVRVCFMGFTTISRERKYEEIMEFSPEHDWLISFDDEVIWDHIDNMIRISKHIKSECEKYGFKFVDSSDDFEKAVDEVVNYLTKKD